MYGSEESDLIVKFYDLAFGIQGEFEAAWYLNKVKKYGGPVLDLACGTGRMAIIIAQAGFKVVGIDQSEGMLKIFRRSMEEQPIQIRNRISILKQDMIEFNLRRKFNTIFCCDAFFHNLSVKDEMDCLTRVADHLAEGGGFFFNLPNPNCEYILKSEKSGGQIFEERGRYRLPDHEDLLIVEQAQDVNPLKQIITTTLRFTILDPEGNQKQLGTSSWKSRYLFKYEAIHLLYRCGFEIKSLVGDYQEGPVNKGSQLIFEAGLKQ